MGSWFFLISRTPPCRLCCFGNPGGWLHQDFHEFCRRSLLRRSTFPVLFASGLIFFFFSAFLGRAIQSIIVCFSFSSGGCSECRPIPLPCNSFCTFHQILFIASSPTVEVTFPFYQHFSHPLYCYSCWVSPFFFQWLCESLDPFAGILSPLAPADPCC